MSLVERQVEKRAALEIGIGRSPNEIGFALSRLFVPRHWPVALPLLLSLFIFRAWLNPTTLIAGADFPSFPDSIVRGGAFGWPHLWTDLRFGYSLSFWANSSKLWAAAGPLRLMGATFPLVERVLWLWPFMLGAPLCGYYLCYRFTRNAYAAALGSCVFAINSWTVGLVERGHIPSLIAFMLFGLIVPAAVDFARLPSVRIALFLAVLVAIQVTYDYRYAYETALILAIVCGLALPRLARKGLVPALVRGGLAFAAGVVALNLDFLLPALLPSTAPPVAQWGTVDSFLAASHYGSLIAALSLYFPWYHWLAGTNGFAETNVEPGFVVLAAIAWLGLLVTRKRPTSRAFLVIAAFGVVLVSETKSSFAQLNLFLYQYVPGFLGFRDFTKFNALIVPVYAVGNALAFAAALALVRLKRPRFAEAGGLATMVLVLAYLFVMRDALNPLRRSNFARVPHLSPGGEATERFLRANLGDASVLMFPSDVRWQRRDYFLRSADANDETFNAPPLGLSPLNPALSQIDSAFEEFSSPLDPELLTELRVKYIVVPDDRRTYYLFEGKPQRWASVDFLRERNWLREVARFGENVVFELRQPPGARAFFAPYPALVIGSPATLEGLVGSSLWTDRAAALIADQMPPNADWLALIPNVIEGPTLIDPAYPLASGGPAAAAQRLAEALNAERYRKRPFSGFVFSSAMLTASAATWNFQSPFGFRFQTPVGGPSRFSFVLQDRRRVPSVIRNEGYLRPVAPENEPSSEISSLSCSRTQVWRQKFDPYQASVPVAASEAGKELLVDNPCPTNFQATVSFRVTSGDLLPRSFSITSGTATSRFVAPPVLSLPTAGTVSLSDILLRPGPNLFEFDKPSSGPLLIDTNYTVDDLHEIAGSFAPHALKLGVRNSVLGKLVYATVEVPRPGLYIGYLDLFGPLTLPLDEHPLCALRFTASNAAGGFALVLDLRNRTNGSALSLWVPIDSRQDADYNLRDLVKDVFDQRFANEVAYRADDPLWAAEHFEQGPPNSPDDFTLRGVRMAATWSVSQTSDVPHAAFVALVRGVRLSTWEPVVGKHWTYRQSSRISTRAVTEKNFTLRGMKLLRVESVTTGSEPHVSAQLSGFTPIDYRLAASLHLGDYVELALQNGQPAAGTIVAESSDYVLLQQGDGTPQRIARDSISSVTRQDITRRVKVDIPISSPFDPTELSFDIHGDGGLKVRIALTYQGPDGSYETIPAVARADTDAAGDDVDPEFAKPSFLLGGVLFDLSVPVDVSLSQTQNWVTYDLDLWRIEHYRFGGLRHRLASLSVEFIQSQNDQQADRQYSVSIADIEVARDRLAGPQAVPISTAPLLQLDNRPIRVASAHGGTGDRYFTAQSDLANVDAGNHVVQSLPVDEVKVRSAMLTQGSPKRFRDGQVTRFDEVTPSETAGAVRGSGLLIVPRTFDGGWQLAIYPPGTSPPALSGFALFDWLRSLPHSMPRSYHVAANTDLDAWYIPPGAGGERSFTMLYLPEALNELGFLTTLAVAIGLCVGWRKILRLVGASDGG